MKLSNKQQEFTRCAAQLINYATSRGWAFTFGDAYRDPRLYGSMGEKKGYSASNSCHKLRLAIDLNLFVDGKYITGDCEEYQELGEHWESINPLARWGGRFNDFNHFSFVHNGFM